MLEQVYNIVDSRYLGRLPFIFTTNLPLAELQAPKDLAQARIYDRVLEHCTPICFNGPNYRKGNTADNAAPITAPEDERPALVKKVCKTTYNERVHFNTTSTETISDKIKRMLRNEIQQM